MKTTGGLGKFLINTEGEQLSFPYTLKYSVEANNEFLNCSGPISLSARNYPIRLNFWKHTDDFSVKLTYM